MSLPAFSLSLDALSGHLPKDGLSELAAYFTGAGRYRARRSGSWHEFTTMFSAQLFEGADGTKYSCATVGGNGDADFNHLCDTLADAYDPVRRNTVVPLLEVTAMQISTICAIRWQTHMIRC